MARLRNYLIWDFDGTLAYRPGLWSRMMVQVAQRYAGKDIDIEVVRPYMRRGFPWHNPERANPPQRSADEWWQSLDPHFVDAFLACDLPAEQAAELAGRVRSVYTDIAEWRLFDDTKDVLRELKDAGWTHVILSNHVPELRDLIAGLGLDGLIHCVINSAETGFEKPHPGAFEAARAALEDAGEVWMIGDNINADVLGAEAAGLRAILVRTEDPRASRRAETLRDVAKFLGEAAT